MGEVMRARHPSSRARDSRFPSVVSILTATACLSLIAAFRKRVACGLWTRTHARVACPALGLRLFELLAGSGRLVVRDALPPRVDKASVPSLTPLIKLKNHMLLPHSHTLRKSLQCSENNQLKELTCARQINGTCKNSRFFFFLKKKKKLLFD